MANLILPGIYIDVKAEALISSGNVSVGNVAIVGTLAEGLINSKTKSGEVYKLGSLGEAKELFDTVDPVAKNPLLKALQLIFGNGATIVYAIAMESDDEVGLTNALSLLENRNVNLITAIYKDDDFIPVGTTLQNHLNSGDSSERIGIVATKDSVADLSTFIHEDGRMIVGAPGVEIEGYEEFSGAMMASALTGLIASLPVQSSPTNKVLNVPSISSHYKKSELQDLVSNDFLAVMKQNGYRVVKGITTAGGGTAWSQITTRRIVDKVTFGVRDACSSYIGKLNNERIRNAMKATIDGLLTKMVEGEALTAYNLEVSATRTQEIEGRAVVNISVSPVFSIDFITVTLYLE